MKLHYLEIVTSDVDAQCAAYQAIHGAEFGDPVAELGNARVATSSEGYRIGFRAPMHDAEDPVVRPYFLTDDISAAMQRLTEAGAEIALPPMEIPNHGTCAICIWEGIHHGLWQL